jgi:hypothetical protein
MARTPSISSVQDYERTRLSMSDLTPPFGPPYTTLPQSDSPSGVSSDDEHGAATPSLGIAENVRGSQSAPPSRQGSDDRALPHQNRARSGDVLDEDSEFGEDDLDQVRVGVRRSSEWTKLTVSCSGFRARRVGEDCGARQLAHWHVREREHGFVDEGWPEGPPRVTPQGEAVGVVQRSPHFLSVSLLI